MIKQAARAALVAAALAVALAGCSSASSAFTGTWVGTGEGRPSLTISDDGRFTGSDGCNSLSGKGTVKGDTFTFGPIASTLKACPGIHTWLGGADTAKVDGGTLTVYGSGGGKLGTLDKE